MRMRHYFTALALVVVPALLWTLWSGLNGSPDHLKIGLCAAVLATLTHTLLILFMILTGRILREAMKARPLGDQYLAELNEFFANKRAYPLAIIAVAVVAAAAVLGYGNRAFGLSPAVHMLAGLTAVFVNMIVIPMEYRALRENQSLIDRVASRLDQLDRELTARGELPGPEPYDPATIVKAGLAVGFGGWMPYLYWVFVEWRGDFGQVSIHPWVEISVTGFFVAFLAMRERAATA